MSRAMIWALCTAALLALVACGAGAGTGPTDVVVTSNPVESVNFTLTVPGVQQERVTDVTAGALTEEQLDEILDKCARFSGIPGADDRCVWIVSDLPPCTPRDALCFVMGRVTGTDGGSDVGAARVQDNRPGSPACSGPKGPTCDVVAVPVAAVAARRAAPVTSSTPAPTTPPSTTGTVAPPTSTAPTGTATARRPSTSTSSGQ